MNVDVCHNIAGGIFVKCPVIDDYHSLHYCDHCKFIGELSWSGCCEEYTSMECNFTKTDENTIYVIENKQQIVKRDGIKYAEHEEKLKNDPEWRRIMKKLREG